MREPHTHRGGDIEMRQENSEREIIVMTIIIVILRQRRAESKTGVSANRGRVCILKKKFLNKQQPYLSHSFI